MNSKVEVIALCKLDKLAGGGPEDESFFCILQVKLESQIPNVCVLMASLLALRICIFNSTAISLS